MANEQNRLSAARHAIDRRRRSDRQRRRRSRRTRSRLLWGLAFILGLNLAAWVSLETPERFLTMSMMLKADKLEHFGMFLAITLVGIPALSRWISAGIVALAILNVGLVVEVAQAFDPTRNADIADFAFDQAGILVGWGVVMAIRRWRARGHHSHDETADSRGA